MSQPTQGAPRCQAAMFVFKDDGERKDEAWKRARKLTEVRCELHVASAPFLDALRDWNGRTDPANAFLAVYAHMGQPGMAPTPQGPLVTWQDFARALSNKVHTLWLAGCSSAHVLAAWPTPGASPVTGSLLITEGSENWMPLVDLFASEVSMDEIRFFDEMQTIVRESLGTDAVAYLDASDASRWRPFPPRESNPQPLTPDEMKNLGALLWGA